MLSSTFLAIASSHMATQPMPVCTLDWKPFLELKEPHAVYFPSSAAWDAYDGVGLGGEMHFFPLKTYLEGNNKSLQRLSCGGGCLESLRRCAAQPEGV